LPGFGKATKIEDSLTLVLLSRLHCEYTTV
jgi:hypothetical protein